MFGANKTPFGGSSFGTGTNAFSAKTPGTSGFGTPTAFGAQTPSTGLFGTGSSAAGGLFGSTGNTFGQPSSGIGFGSSNTSSAAGTLFSSTSNAGTTGLFSTPSTSTSFGAAGFGAAKPFGAAPSTGLFGQTAAATAPFGQAAAGASSLFGGGANSGLFGATAQSGTTVKFNPVTSSDTMVKSGVTTTVSTRHLVITAMKEYENKCFEELRMEDYAANRKGSSGSSLLGHGMTQVDNKPGGLFGQQAASSGAGFTFGQNKPTFGTGTTTFGTTSGSMFGAQPQQQQTAGLFGQKAGGFGTTSAQGTSLFGTTSTSAFGQSNQAKGLFGQTATTQATSLFGSTPAAGTAGFGTGFGNTSFNTNQQSSLFGAKAGFGATPTSTGLTLGSNTGTGLFGQQNKPGLSLGTGASTGFGFGANPNQSTSLFANKGTTGFGGLGAGIGTGLGTGFGTTNTGTSLFGATSKPNTLGGLGGFGTTSTGLGGGFGTGTGLNLGGATTGLGNATANLTVQDAQAQQQLLAIFNSPFGDNPLFRNRLTDSDKREDILKPTSKAAQKALSSPLQHKVSSRPSAKLRPKPLIQGVSHKSKLFDGLDDEDLTLNTEMFVPRRSVKKLVIKKKEDKSMEEDQLLNSSRSLAQEENLLSPLPTYPSNPASKPSPSITQRQGSMDNEEVLETPGGTRLFSKHQSHQNDIPTTSSPNKQDDPDCTITDLIVKPKQPNKLNSSELSFTSDLDHSSQPDIQDDLENTPPPNPAGVMLRRSGYYTIPSLEEVGTMMGENGECYVEDLTIGREGYGSVFFPGLTNVAGLNLDEIVHFRRKEITVYPDDTHKPDVGQGLNKKAEVTLDNTWPTDKTSRNAITDVERLIALNYEDKLERATVKLGAKFIEYRPDTGSWVFLVQHFSKYGLSDSDEDDDAPSQDPKKQKTQKQPGQKSTGAKKVVTKPAAKQHPKMPQDQKVSPNGSQLTREQEEEPMGEDIDMEMPRDSPIRGLGGFSPKPYLNGHVEAADHNQQRLSSDQEEQEEVIEHAASSHRLANVLGMNSHRLQVMKGSFFADDEPVEYDYASRLAPSQTRPSFFDSPSRGSPVPIMEDSYQERGLSRSMGGGVLSSLPMGSPAKYLAGMGPSADVRASPIPRAIKEEMLDPSDHYVSGLFAAPKQYPAFTAGMTQDRPSRLVGSRPRQTILPLKQSVICGKVPCIADAGLVMSRSFRVGWGPNWTLVHSGKAVGQRMSVLDIKQEPVAFPLLTAKQPTKSSLDATPFTITVEKVNLAPHLLGADNKVLDLHEHSLEVQLHHSICSTTPTCPVFVPKPGVDCVHDFAKVAMKDCQDRLTADHATLEHSQLVWKLMVALWGRLPDEDEQELDPSGYPLHKARREAFSQWLETGSWKRINREVQDSKFKDMGHIEAVFSLLTGHQISEACAAAQRSGDHRLALLLAQAGSTQEIKQLITKQLSDWHEMGVDKFIAPEYLQVYALLAGQLVWQSSYDSINTCKNLDWKRALAVHLWHACKPLASIEDALAEFDKGFHGESSLGRYCPMPRPPYMENNPEVYPEEGDMGYEEQEIHGFMVWDMCYHLVKLYTDHTHRLERVLAPTTHTAYQLDYRLSWHVLQALQALGYSHISEQDLNHLHVSFASQLEGLGLWHWAVFVLLHIQDDCRREFVVKELLMRQCTLTRSEENSAKERFIFNQLHVPIKWINEAKALKALYEKRPHHQAWHLLESGHWNDGHSVIIKHLAADAIINENYDYLLGLLKNLVPTDRAIMIQDWTTNGQVFLDFINIVKRLEHLQRTNPTVYELEKLYPDVASLCSRVGSVTCCTAKDRLCQSEMAKRTANVMKAVLTLQQQSLYPGKHVRIPSRLLAPHVGKLPMPEDYGLQELRELTRSYMVELTTA